MNSGEFFQQSRRYLPHVDDVHRAGLSGSGRCHITELPCTILEAESERRKTAEAHCTTLLSELESREGQLEELKSKLFARVLEAEGQMKKLVKLRDKETDEAQKATARLRTSITKLRQRHEDEKRQLEETLKGLKADHEFQLVGLKEALEESESNRKLLFSQLKKSEANVAKLSEELIQLKKELSQHTARIAELIQANSEANANLTKLKIACQKASSRAETSAKQLAELRKQSEQVSMSSTQAEQTARTANERRAAAESALSAVRQRSDSLAARVAQLERELATERAQTHEKHANNESEISRLKRRVMAVQSEAAKWKRSWQDERQAHTEQTDKLNEVLQSVLDDRSKLESNIRELRDREAERSQLVDQLQRQAAMEATNASSRLLVALSTGEEGVATALELKRCIEEKLQPELESTKKLLEKTDLESKEWRRKYEELNLNMAKCQMAAKEMERRLAERQIIVEQEKSELKAKLTKAEEETQMKAILLARAEEQAGHYEADLVELRKAQTSLKTAADHELTGLIREQADLKAAFDTTVERLKAAQRLATRLKAARDSALTGQAKAQVELKEARDSHELAFRQKVEEINAVKSRLKQTEDKLAATEAELQQAHEDVAHQLRRKSEECENTVNDLKLKLSEEVQRGEQLQSWICELRGLLTEAESTQRSTQESLEQCEKRLQDSEHCVSQLQETLVERGREVEHLEMELAERKRLLEQRASELVDLQAAVENRILKAQKDADTAMSERSKIDAEKHGLEDRLKRTDLCLIQSEEAKNKLITRVTELENELSNSKQSNSDQKDAQYRSQEGLREELAIQLKEAQQQRDRATDCLREANQFLVEQTANKQQLLDELKDLQIKHERIQAQLRQDMEANQRDKLLLQQQVEDMRSRLHRAESMVQESDARALRAESEMKKVIWDSERLALERASRNAVSQATASVLGMSPNRSASLVPRTTDLKRDEDSTSSIQLIPVHRNCWTQRSDSEYRRPKTPISDYDSRKVKFAPMALLDSEGNTRSGSGSGRNAASELEALIREVTSNLDDEANWT